MTWPPATDALVLVTEWPEFRELPFEAIAKSMKHPLLVDSKNFLDPEDRSSGPRLSGLWGFDLGQGGEQMKKVAIIGAGLQAKRRSGPIVDDRNYELALVVDRDEKRAKSLAEPLGAQVATDWRVAIDDPSISAVLVLTYPNTHAEIAIAALEAGKDVLCEKPLTRTEAEARALIAAADKSGHTLKCGFNHRHHPAVLEAHRLFQSGLIGKPVFGRGRYGIGARTGVESEWRSDPAIVAGGS